MELTVIILNGDVLHPGVEDHDTRGLIGSAEEDGESFLSLHHGIVQHSEAQVPAAMALRPPGSRNQDGHIAHDVVNAIYKCKHKQINESRSLASG